MERPQLDTATIDGRYRIAWTLNGRDGYGDWSDDFVFLSRRVDELCLRYGERTHWIEERPAHPDVARAALLASRK